MGGNFFLETAKTPSTPRKEKRGADKLFRAVLRGQKPGFFKKPGFSVPHKG